MMIYDNSRYENEKCNCYMAKDEHERFLVVTGGSRAKEFKGEIIPGSEGAVRKCPLSIYNSRLIRQIFPFTSPVSAKGRKFSLGLGDRLGIASAGHIKAIRSTGTFPVLAQQSTRELKLTGRTFDDVLSDVTWSVLQEGYRDGFGADGDHLKTKDEISMALKAGYSMITLDCSDYIGTAGPEKVQMDHMNKYKGKKFILGNGAEINISDGLFSETMLIYGAALKFTVDVYNELLINRQDIDFELSIDETTTPTKPEAHFLIGAWLREKNIRVMNIAPRFCGEFQKGIDYRGNPAQFEKEMNLHQAIAGYFGHRLSIHSGSDKFTVFPIIGKITGLNCHVKTAGTNWLEALRCVAVSQPDLFRAMYGKAVEVLDEAKEYYHIYTEKNMAPEIDDFENDNIANLLEIDESRQILHITYGFLLKTDSPYREKFFSAMHKNETLYHRFLMEHIRRHLDSLNQ